MTTEHAHTTPSPAGKERRGRPRRAAAAPDNRPVAERVAMALETLAARADPAALAGMARYGIATARAYGVPMPMLRAMARDLGRDHDLALALWDTGAREARLLATMVDVPARVTVEQMEQWVAAFDSWDLCDGCCGNLFVRTPYAWEMATTWSAREEEFVKRAGFVLMADLAVHDKRAPDEQFLPFLDCIRREAGDERNFVRKAVNWALRQAGKRSPALNAAAVETARAIAAMESRGARWVAADALRELTGAAVQDRLAAPKAVRRRRASASEDAGA